MKLSVISDQLSGSGVQWRRKAGSTETTQSDSKSRSEKQIPRVAGDDKARRRGMRVERDQAAFDSERVIHHRGHREHRGTRLQRKGEAPASASEGGRYTDQPENDARPHVARNASAGDALQEQFKNQAADSGRNTRWKRGPVNWTPTTRSPLVRGSVTCTTRP
jgi:hypothetical protein